MQQQQTDLTLHIGSILPALLQIAPVGARMVLDVYRTAWLSRKIVYKDKLYQIVEITLDNEKPGKIVARLEPQE